MVINEIAEGRQYLPLQQQTIRSEEPTDQEPTFANTLKEFISDVNSLQLDSKDMTERFIKGEPVDLHDVMITAEKAKTSFQLLLELRNKALDLYKEVNRMQV